MRIGLELIRLRHRDRTFAQPHLRRGTKSIPFTVPTCAGGPDQPVPSYRLTTGDSTQADRLGRNGRPSTCSGKISPGGGFAGTKYYKTWTFTNTSGAARCYTVTINAALGGPGDIESAAYDQVYDPTMLNANYLGDSGISGLGTTVDSATYSFTVPAGHNFVVVVNTTGTTESSQFSGTVSGCIDNTAGPGDCATIPDIASAVSRKMHGIADSFDIDLPLTGTRGVECRSGGATGDYKLVFTFPNNLTSVAGASVTGHDPATGTGTVSSSMIGPNLNQYTVNLTNVSNVQYITVTLNSLVDAAGHSGNVVGPQMGVLLGDVNNNGSVTNADVSAVKLQVGAPATLSNFRDDVNANGVITNGDVSTTKAQVGASLP